MRFLGKTILATMVVAALAASACADKKGEPITVQPDASHTGGKGGAGALPTVTTGKVDVLFVVDNSSSMADKQQLLAKAVPNFIGRLVNPLCVDTSGVPSATQPASGHDACPTGTSRQFVPATDMRVGFVSSSLGSHGSDYCTEDSKQPFNPTQNDAAHLLTRSGIDTTGNPTGTVATYQDSGLLVWDAASALTPPGDSDLATFVGKVAAVTTGAGQVGCGFEAPLEAWYRFLIDPNPPGSVAPNDPNEPLAGAKITGTDTTLLAQRASFSRPDSLLLVVMLSDEDDCSVIDGVMTPDVCDDPKLDVNGKPVGCNTARIGWPAGYAEGNFFKQTTSPDGRVSGMPWPANNLSAQLYHPTSKTCDGDLVTGAPYPFCLQSGTPACATDPTSPDCQTCYSGGEGCTPKKQEDPNGDPTNLRCWNQKQRFGVDMLYPMRRYVDGLTQARVYDRDGFLVANPLFANGRPLGTVIFTGIVGVPWQDIARSVTNPSSGARPTTGTDALDWDLVLGNRYPANWADYHPAVDPVMRDQNTIRNGTHPVTSEPINATTWNSVNGHEWTSAPADLEYACIFNLEPEEGGDYGKCSEGSGSKAHLDESKNPLCEVPVSAEDRRGTGTYDDPPKQYRAKAYPAPRMLEVIRRLGPQGSLNSICAASTQDASSESFGYRPALNTLVDHVAPQLRAE